MSPEDRAALAEHGIEPFDLVCVNLYPFELAVDRPELGEAGLIEMIDVGGPALLRAAAKNFASVAAVCRPADYDDVLDELRANGADVAGAAPPARRGRVREDRGLRVGDRALVPARRGASRRRSSRRSIAPSSSRTARTRIRPRRTTPSGAPACTCSRS